jgi:RNA polymerase sigma-70 factor (ECF subfamily)
MSAFDEAAQRAVKNLEGTQLAAADFAAELKRRFEASKLDALNLDDLLLAWGALEKDPAALKEFDRRLRACGSRASDDVLQQARQRLLVGDGKKPKLLAYAGQGALVKWLRTVVLSISIDARRKEKPDQHEGDEKLAMKASSDVGADVRLMKAHHREEFTRAFGAALKSLTAQQRTVLRMRFVDGVSIEDVGRTFNVHRTTAMRWMEQAFQMLLDQTRAQLSDRLKLRPSELDSLLRAFEPSLAERLSRLLPKSQ